VSFDPPPRRRRFRPIRWFQRVLLGVMMTVVAWVVERQLLKAIKKSGQKLKEEPAPEAGNESIDVGSGPDVGAGTS
jgi:hypothetical protein